MNQNFEDAVMEAIDDAVNMNLGGLINDSIEDMMYCSDMTTIQQLSVIDGAIALGYWCSNPTELAQLRAWRTMIVESMDD